MRATEHIFSLQIFLYHTDMHMRHQKEKSTPLHSYISRSVNVGLALIVFQNVNKCGNPTSFVFSTIHVECMCNLCNTKVEKIQKISCKFCVKWTSFHGYSTMDFIAHKYLHTIWTYFFIFLLCLV